MADLVKGHLSEALLKVTISCPYLHLPKGCDMEDISKPKIRRGQPKILYVTDFLNRNIVVLNCSAIAAVGWQKFRILR